MELSSLTLVSVLVAVASNATHGSVQSRSSSDVVFLDVNLSAAAANLLREVGRIYEKAVVGEKTRLPGDSWASSRVDDDGTPRIRVAPPGEGDEGIIVHELFHLKLRSRGAPVFYWLSDGGEPALDALLAMQAQLYDAIQHRAFAPEMRKLGFEPSARLRASLRKMIAVRAFNGSAGDFGRAMVFARTFLEFGPGVELTSLERWYREEGWGRTLELGERLVQVLTPLSTDSTDHVSQFLVGLRVLGVDVKLERYDEVMLGKHRQVRAVVIHRQHKQDPTTMSAFALGKPRVGLMMRPMTLAAAPLLLFAIAALLEIAGCFAFWHWLRRGGSPAWAFVGIVGLAGFAVALTRVDAPFAGRAYAAYGGIYIAMALAWLRVSEGQRPTFTDVLGSGLAIVGALIILSPSLRR